MALVAALFLACVDAVKIEFPCLGGAIEGILDRDTVADFPAKTLCERGSCNCALLILYEIVPLSVGYNKFGHHLALVVHVNDKLRKEIPFVLIYAPEPMIVSHSFDTRNRADFVVVGKRQHVDEPYTIDGHQAVGEEPEL